MDSKGINSGFATNKKPTAEQQKLFGGWLMYVALFLIRRGSDI